MCKLLGIKTRYSDLHKKLKEERLKAIEHLLKSNDQATIKFLSAYLDIKESELAERMPERLEEVTDLVNFENYNPRANILADPVKFAKLIEADGLVPIYSFYSPPLGLDIQSFTYSVPNFPTILDFKNPTNLIAAFTIKESLDYHFYRYFKEGWYSCLGDAIEAVLV